MADTGRTEAQDGDWKEIPATIGVLNQFQNESASTYVLLAESAAKPTALYPPAYVLSPKFFGTFKPSAKLWIRVNERANSTMTAIIVHSDGGDNLLGGISLEAFVIDGLGNVVVDASGNAVTI